MSFMRRHAGMWRLPLAVGLGVMLAACGGPSGPNSDSTPTSPGRISLVLAASKTLQDGEVGAGRLIADPARRLLYVDMGCPDACAQQGVWILNPDLSVRKRIALPSGCSERQEALPMALDEMSGRLIAGHCQRPSAFVLDDQGNVRSLALPFPSSFLATDDRGTLFVAGSGLAAVDLADGSVLWQSSRAGGAIVWSTGALYAWSSPTTIVEIDPRSGVVKRSAELASPASCLQATTDLLLAREGGEMQVQRVARTDGMLLDAASIDSDDCAFAVDDRRGLFFALNENDMGDSAVIAYDLRSFVERSRVSVGLGTILWLALDAANGRLFLTHGSEVKRIDITQ